MNRPRPTLDACMAVLSVVLMLICTVGAGVVVGTLIAIAWRVVFR